MKNRTLLPIEKAPALPKRNFHKFSTFASYARKHKTPRGQAYYRLYQLDWKAFGYRFIAFADDMKLPDELV